METKKAARVYIIDQICDICKKGVMRPTNRQVPGYPPQIQHSCVCGYIQNYPHAYPRQSFEEIPVMIEEHPTKPAPQVELLAGKIEFTDHGNGTATVKAIDAPAIVRLVSAPPIELTPAEELEAAMKTCKSDQTDLAKPIEPPKKRKKK